MEILKNIATFVLAPILALLPFQNVNLDQATLNNKIDQAVEQRVGAYNISGGGTYRLKSSAGISDSTLQLSSFKEPISNIPYTMTYLNTTIAYGTVDPQTSRSEFISFTGITQNSDGSATLTGVIRGLTRTPAGNLCTASTTLAQKHPGQSVFILSDSPCHFAQYAVKSNDEVISGSWTVPTPTADSNPATKAYVDSVVNGGAVSHDTVIVAATAGETVSIGQIVYFDQYADEWLKADASLASTTDAVMLGIAQGTGIDGGSISGGVLLHGIDDNQGNTLTAGQTFYLSDTAGATSTSAGTVVKKLGLVKDNNEFYFDPFFGSPQLSTDNTWTATSTHKANIISKAFGGTGSDGALNISSGTTTIDIASSTSLVKNYTSISITGTGVLNFSNSNAYGTVVNLKSQGDCNITSSRVAIVMTGMGAIGGAPQTQATGTDGVIGSILPAFTAQPGGGQGGSCGNDSPCTPGAIASGGATSSPRISATTTIQFSKSLPIIIGGGGGAGGGGNVAGTRGGNGGGALILECGGNLNFTSRIEANGNKGIDAPGGVVSPGGSGGGGGGTVWILYNYLVADTGTITATGGSGGASNGDGCGGVKVCPSGGGGGGSNTVGSNGTAGTTSGAGGGGAGGTGVYGVFQNLGF